MNRLVETKKHEQLLSAVVDKTRNTISLVWIQLGGQNEFFTN